MTVGSVLREKGNQVFTILESKSIKSAVEEMVKNRVGALVVLNQKSKVIGIISERDIIRKVIHANLSLEHTSVDKVMSSRLIICFPEDSLDYVQQVMTEQRIRHVPVFKGKEMIGLISIGDVVKSRLEVARVEIKFLEDYIQGRYPG